MNEPNQEEIFIAHRAASVLPSIRKGRHQRSRDLPREINKEPLGPVFDYHAYAEKIAGEGLALSIDPVCRDNPEVGAKIERVYGNIEGMIKAIETLKNLKGEWSKKEKEIGLVASVHLSVQHVLWNMKETYGITNIPALLELDAALENHWQALKKVVDMSQFQKDKPEPGN